MHVIKNAPTTSKATSGHISAFMNNLLNTHAVCESCHAQIKYAGGYTQCCQIGWTISSPKTAQNINCQNNVIECKSRLIRAIFNSL